MTVVCNFRVEPFPNLSPHLELFRERELWHTEISPHFEEAVLAALGVKNPEINM